MMAGLSQLSQMCALRSFSSWVQWKCHWVLSRSRASCHVLIMRSVTSHLLSLQPCSPFIKWLMRVRMEDANSPQKEFATHSEETLNLLPTLKNWQSPHAKLDFWLLSENWGIGSWDPHSKMVAAGWHWSWALHFAWSNAGFLCHAPPLPPLPIITSGPVIHPPILWFLCSSLKPPFCQKLF